MRSLLLAAVAVLALAPESGAAVITYTQPLNASQAMLRDGPITIELTRFDPALGTVTGAQLTFSGTLNTGQQPVRLFPGDMAPVAVNLASYVTLNVPPGTGQETLPVLTSPVVNGASLALATQVRVSVALPIAPAYLSDPFVNFSVYTVVSRTDGVGLNNSGTNFDPTSASGVLALTYTYTAAATSVPEPVSLSLLGIGLAGLAVARRRQAA